MGAPWLTAALEAAASTWGALDLLVEVTLEPWIGSDGDYNEPVFGSPITLEARVSEGALAIRNTLGEEVAARAFVAFEGVIPDTTANGSPAAPRRNPIDPRDRITLPSGYTGPIVENVADESLVEVFGSPQTAGRFRTAVWLR
jgi:hypothetical protein